VNRLRGLFRDHFQVGLPHVAANELERLSAVAAEKTKESKQCFGGAFRSDPEQTLAPFVYLVHQRLVFVAAFPLDFVDADRLNVIQTAMR